MSGSDQTASDADAAPLPLRWVEELVNTRSIEFDTEDLASPAAAASWLHARGLVPAARRVTSADLARLVRLREGLRALLVDVTDPPGDPVALRDLAELAAEVPLVVDVERRPPALTPPRPGTVDGALAVILAAISDAVAAGTWERLKVCREPGCRWAYYDHSRNRSRSWCSMSTCGNRAKARTFRRAAKGPG